MYIFLVLVKENRKNNLKTEMFDTFALFIEIKMLIPIL